MPKPNDSDVSRELFVAAANYLILLGHEASNEAGVLRVPCQKSAILLWELFGFAR